MFLFFFKMLPWTNPPSSQGTEKAAPGGGHSKGTEKANLLAGGPPGWRLPSRSREGSRKESNKQCWTVQRGQPELSPTPRLLLASRQVTSCSGLSLPFGSAECWLNPDLWGHFTRTLETLTSRSEPTP